MRFPRSDALYVVPDSSQVRPFIYDFLKCCDLQENATRNFYSRPKQTLGGFATLDNAG